jgi:two-component system response regulator AtoC
MFDEPTETGRPEGRHLCLEITLPDIPPYFVSLANARDLLIGRSSGATIQVDHRSVSREHARIRLGSTIEIEDLGSRNGTRVRGKEIFAGERTELGISEAFEVGSVILRLLPERRSEPSVGRPERRQPNSGRSALDVPEGWCAPRSEAMRTVLEAIDRVAASDMSVLLLGETGVGKEVCAELVHRRSERASATLLRLNCTALPESLIESELFGHEKGAFTGATEARPGLLESADGGTVFLDEIAELPMSVQAKLLRVLDRREVLRIGGRTAKTVDVRFVAATHKSLESEIAASRFRQDLYYRLAGMTIRIPPLRERVDEIASLALEFLAAAARRQRRSGVSLSSEAVSALEAHPWPGNIRELRNAIERALVVCTGKLITSDHLALEIESGPIDRPTMPIPRAARLTEEVDHLERSRIQAALDHAGGNQSEAARRLGISRGALLARLRAWNKNSRPD